MERAGNAAILPADPLITDHWSPFSRRGGRAVDCAGLENRKAERPREFESHPLRQQQRENAERSTSNAQCLTQSSPLSVGCSALGVRCLFSNRRPTISAQKIPRTPAHTTS